MNALDILECVLMMLAGLGVFLIGIKAMGDNLEAVAGNSLKSIFNKISNNRFTGVAVGAGVTAIIQSSSATTVMVVGFVNAGVMTLTQATSIIMGANIGTTITAQIVSLQSLPITAFFAAMACVGAFMQTSKKLHVRNVGSIIAGVGVLFVGLDVMSSAMKQIAEIEAVRNLLNATTNPLLLLLLGAVITAVIQSSSVTTSIIISMGISGLIGLESAVYTTLGINIGTCITAVLACIGSTVNAKRTSIIHLLFNCIGSFLFFIVFLILDKFTTFFTWMSGTFNGSIANQIAMFHTAFNVITTLLLLPFVKALPKLAMLIVPDKKSSADDQKDIIETEKFQFIDNRLLSTPSIALVMIRKEILAMADLAKNNLDLSIQAVKTKDLSQKALFDVREKRIDFLNKAITKYTIKVSSEHISYISEKESASYYYVVSNIERVGDYAQNIMEYTQELIDYNAEFSDTAKKEIDDMKIAIDNLYDAVVSAFERQDITQEETIKDLEEIVDDYKANLERSHLIRLGNGQCSAESAGVFLSLVSNMERIADHILNVFKSMKQYTQVTKTTHVLASPKA